MVRRSDKCKREVIAASLFLFNFFRLSRKSFEPNDYTDFKKIAQIISSVYLICVI